MHALPTRVVLDLPTWVPEELADLPSVLATREDRMRVVNRLASRNHREGGGGPFAALVVRAGTGELVSAGVNVVLGSGISSGHAEVVALGLAQTAVGTWDLGGPDQPEHELVVNWRPCIQCYGAVIWSGVRRLVVAGHGPELEEITGFDEGPLGADWAEQLRARGIGVVTDVLREEALEVYREYRAEVDGGRALVYNARRSSSS